MILPIVDCLLVQHDEELSLLRFKWLDARQTDIRPCLRHGLQLMQHYRPDCALVDLNDLPNLTIEDQLWLTVKWFPQIASLNLNRVALVLPAANLYNQMAIEAILWTGRKLMRFDLQFFTDPAAGLDWLTDSSGRMAALHMEWAQAQDAFGVKAAEKQH